MAIVNITITLTEVNDNVPLFKRSWYHFNVTENFGTFLGNVSATDLDAAIDDIEYYVIDLDGHNGISRPYVYVNNEGNLYSDKTMDREKWASFQVTVEARNKRPIYNGGRLWKWDRCIVTVDVLDIDDNYPKFQQNIFYMDIIG